jgi:ethanolamine utilization protein EutQ (cupin superfamily)
MIVSAEVRLGVFQDDEEVFATPGDIVFKPRGHGTHSGMPEKDNGASWR